MSQASFDSIRPDYGACTVASQVGGYVLDCRPNCSAKTIGCGMSVFVTQYNCDTPPGASAIDCHW
jgi:hypothetical protein